MNKFIILVILLLFTFGCKKSATTLTIPTSTDPKLPKLLTNNISNLTYFSVVVSGKIIDSAGAKITESGFVVDTLTNPTTTKNFKKFLVKNLSNDGTFTLNITYLPSNVTYYLRSYAVTSNGTGYGNEIKFTTLFQKTFTGDVNLSSQQQVINFGANHYTTINGALNISGTVTDMTPLLGLAIINNGFNITNSLIQNFKGLDSLEITGAIFANGFWVERNNNLLNFSGLSKLKTTRGSAQIDNNNSLINLDGLDSYTDASAGALRIGECPKLKSLSGLKKFSFVGDNFYIINNASLTDISGLANLSTVFGRLYIVNNSSLQNLTGLEKIQSLPDGIEITNNALLNDLSGIRNLNLIKSTVGIGSIEITGNPLIADLSAFGQISTVDYVIITNNKSLKSLSGLKSLQIVTNFLHIENNSSLLDFSGLEKLTSISRLEVSNNSALQNLKGLSGLTKIVNNPYSIFISNNNNLQSLTGLDNIVTADGSIQITNNAVLTDFCPIKTLFVKGYNNFFSAINNAANPSQKDVMSNCH